MQHRVQGFCGQGGINFNDHIGILPVYDRALADDRADIIIFMDMDHQPARPFADHFGDGHFVINDFLVFNGDGGKHFLG